MRLLLHNMLKSNAPGVVSGYPLKLECTDTRNLEVEYNEDFLKNIFLKIDYEVLRQASQSVGFQELSETQPPEALQDKEFLKLLHHALMEIDVVEGNLICPDTGHKYTIHESIPNMLI
ncbi:hypothetical protein HZS_1898 [Henneguya salminicola]|nr:hypothetical protein HZS_1898 [Henneguya salminicola]